MYLLDTNICIALMKKNVKAMAEFASKGRDCYASTITLGELYKGVYCSQRFDDNLTALNKFINLIKFVSFDDMAALEFGKIQAELRKKRTTDGRFRCVNWFCGTIAGRYFGDAQCTPFH
ncbi:type II toxin-antitoxin system VapC family toxin [Spirulina sp. 06S082]|nr:type II toxin-antitoxin system VapC family toxin [Spirulina sp. 06S082]MEA5469945.1 type II toxin-antitoxin system VapC family toxin [Spirulina sp. 06S082]